jgi:phage/conjugal plasmid C-4 type zinc finger TraR family protein
VDECDLASDCALRDQADALAKHRSKRTPGAISRMQCIECGEDIPEKRRQAVQGCTRCVLCESENERRT